VHEISDSRALRFIMQSSTLFIQGRRKRIQRFHSRLLRRSIQAGFLIWGRTHFPPPPVLPPTESQAKVKKKSEPSNSTVSPIISLSTNETKTKVRDTSKPVNSSVFSHPTTPIEAENPLSIFSGEPQIVQTFAISQLTPREPTSPVASC
jgi:cytoskeletal protein RodZ